MITLDRPSDDGSVGRETTLTAATAPERAPWERPAVVVLLVATAVLYLWGLGASGWANSFYSAAAQAGSQSWKAWFFGSFDAASSITVDKPPASLWIMGLSVRVFGLSSWSILVPQALMGVATVAVVYAAVRRKLSAAAGLIAGAVMATTPVAALMFRFNNPDALLVLLMTLAAYTTLRAIDDGRRRWIVATGALIGFGFLTKQLQVLLVVPPLGLAYLVAAPPKLGRRVVDLLIALASMVVSAGWWIAAVMLTPVGSRPFIGGSQHNSILELTLGYNGFGRLTGEETGSVGASVWGRTGLTRMFDGVIGGQVAWLMPAALLFTVAGLWMTRRAPRTDSTRVSIIVWGGWLIVTAIVFSLMKGIFHEYYTVRARARDRRARGHRGAPRVAAPPIALRARRRGRRGPRHRVLVVGVARPCSGLERMAAAGHHSRRRRHGRSDLARAPGRSGQGLRGRGDRRRGRLAVGLDGLGGADGCDTARRARSSPPGPACSAAVSVSAACRSPLGTRAAIGVAIEVASPAATGSAASQVAAADPVRDRCLEPDPSHQLRTERCSAEGSAARPPAAC